MSDVRSNPNDQIAHAVRVIGRSEARKEVFCAICRGKRPVKSSSDIAFVTHLSKIRVQQEAGKLASNGILQKVKLKGEEMAYHKDAFYCENKKKILRMIADKRKLESLPTKITPKFTGSKTIRIVVPRQYVRTKQITINDIASFSKVRKLQITPSKIVGMSETYFKEGIKQILGERGVFKDWGGESSDLFTTRVDLQGRRMPAAFAFKGKATKGKLTPKKMGKNGDQIQRLFTCPAQVFIVQYFGQIDQSIIDLMNSLATAKSVSEGKPIFFGVVDDNDSQRIIAAYSNSF